MATERQKPADIARRLSQRSAKHAASAKSGDFWRRDKAREWFVKFPKAAYMTEIEFWRELSDGQIEFTIRRLPSAD
jgi:hypothetical protein